MLILSPYKNKILRPVSKKDWRAPSQALPKDVFGNEDQVRFRVRARTDDGFIVWRGWFDDRDDFDAFLYAIALGNLRQQRALWHLPQPAWFPGLDPQLTYDFATVTFLTSPTGSNQTFTSPSDWNNSNNTIEVIAGAGGGVSAGTNHSTGGGGAEYGATTNFTFATPGTTTATYRIGAGAAGAAGVGNPGGDSWWNGTTQAGATLGAIHGNGGANGSGSQSGGAGGTGGVGTTHKAGGRGGNLTGASGGGGSGGGGAGGSTGAGNAGADSSATTTVATNGGSGDGGSGGAGGTGAVGGSPSAGGNGTEWDATHGSGGGGGGAATTGNGASGGNYGGGGAGAHGGGSAGAGIQGIVVVTYTPAASVVWANSAMMGM